MLYLKESVKMSSVQGNVFRTKNIKSTYRRTILLSLLHTSKWLTISNTFAPAERFYAVPTDETDCTIGTWKEFYSNRTLWTKIWNFFKAIMGHVHHSRGARTSVCTENTAEKCTKNTTADSARAAVRNSAMTTAQSKYSNVTITTGNRDLYDICEGRKILRSVVPVKVFPFQKCFNSIRESIFCGEASASACLVRPTKSVIWHARSQLN